MRSLQELVDAADSAELLIAVDALCASRQWDQLADLARRCRDAVEMGKQLWPVAMHIDYRLAFEGPAAHAAAVLRPGAGRFALGPLTEVAASTHDWDSLAPHLADPASTATVAQERVLRGEDLTSRTDPVTAELPLHLADWEPPYALPRYRDRSAEFPAPQVAERRPAGLRPLRRARRLQDDDAVRALRDVVETWIAESAGSVAAVAAEGPAEAAVAELTERAAIEQIDPADGIALLQWAGASGGAYGRRRGGAAGRFSAWWTVAALAGVPWDDDRQLLADELEGAVKELQWLRWRPAEPELGWVLRLAVADPTDGLAWAVDASDRRDDGVQVLQQMS